MKPRTKKAAKKRTTDEVHHSLLTCNEEAPPACEEDPPAGELEVDPPAGERIHNDPPLSSDVPERQMLAVPAPTNAAEAPVSLSQIKAFINDCFAGIMNQQRQIEQRQIEQRQIEQRPSNHDTGEGQQVAALRAEFREALLDLKKEKKALHSQKGARPWEVRGDV